VYQSKAKRRRRRINLISTTIWWPGKITMAREGKSLFERFEIRSLIIHAPSGLVWLSDKR
jgi:hypothetical protein